MIRTSLALLLVGCTGAATETPSPPATVEPAKIEPAQVEPTKLPPPEPVPQLGRDHRSFVPCKTDADCGWNDPCVPTRCVEAGITAACEETAPPPGSCLCLAGACTTKPDPLPEPSGTCEIRGCEVDRAAGKCVADTGDVPEAIRSRPGIDVGPSCDCPRPADGCVMSWFDAVPCKSDRDCWVSPSPRRHPIARPKNLRTREFQPCQDGEVAPKCGDAGTCVLGPAYSC